MTRPVRGKGEPIDWQGVRERLSRAEAATAAAVMLSPERARSVLDERARSLARPAADAMAAEATLELLCFALGRERYGIETRFVREVMRLVELTPVPTAPKFIVGITNLRGEVLAVVDLRKFFQVEDKGLTDLSRVIVLGTDEADMGVLADSVHAIDRLPAAAILDAPESVAGIGREYLRGVTREALIVLDGAALIQDKRLVVDQTETALST